MVLSNSSTLLYSFTNGTFNSILETRVIKNFEFIFSMALLRIFLVLKKIVR